MTIAKSLTWQYDLNVPVAVGAATVQEMFQRVWFQWKTWLTGTALVPMTVAGSSNGSAAGMDGVDRWAAYTDVAVQTSGSPHAWIVLQCPTTGAQILLSAITNTTSTCATVKIAVTHGGLYTGGTTTVDPTATDECVILPGIQTLNSWGHTVTSGTPRSYVFHGWRAATGEASMWALMSSNNLNAFGYIGRIENPRYANAFVASLFANTSTSAANALPSTLFIDQHYSTSSTTFTDQVGQNHRAWFANLPVSSKGECYLTGVHVNVSKTRNSQYRQGTFETNSTSGFVPSTNQALSEEENPSIGCYCNSTGDRGTHGRLYDVRWCGDHLSNGQTFPSDGSRQWVKVGPLLLPNGGDVLVMS